MTESRSWMPLVSGGLFGAAVILGFVSVMTLLLLDNDSDRKARELCDQAVAQLLHSSDLVEVTRAGIIIDRLNCAVRRRLP